MYFYKPVKTKTVWKDYKCAQYELIQQLCLLMFLIYLRLVSYLLKVRAWLLSLGFTLSYGSMFSKIWTVHQMTTARRKERNVSKIICIFKYYIFTIILCFVMWSCCFFPRFYLIMNCRKPEVYLTVKELIIKTWYQMWRMFTGILFIPVHI